MGLRIWDFGFALSYVLSTFWVALGQMSKILRAIFCVVLPILVACGTAKVRPVDPTSREVRDDLGQTIVVPNKIDRAISLAPNITEMVFAVGAGDKLVGVTTYCNYPHEATKIEKVGDTQTPNIEKIVALKPQIVLVSTASQLEAFSQTLNEQRIAVYVVNVEKLDDIYGSLRQFGELFEQQAAAENVIFQLSSRESYVRLIANHHPPDPDRVVRPRVFVQISNEPLFTIGKDSFLTELVKLAGGIPVTNDIATAYPKLSKETAAALDPDVIFLSDSEDNREPNVALRNSKAVRNGRVYRINADIISRPGPRLVDALEEMAMKLKEKNS